MLSNGQPMLFGPLRVQMWLPGTYYTQMVCIEKVYYDTADYFFGDVPRRGHVHTEYLKAFKVVICPED
jgi:hypothetical protein